MNGLYTTIYELKPATFRKNFWLPSAWEWIFEVYKFNMQAKFSYFTKITITWLRSNIFWWFKRFWKSFYNIYEKRQHLGQFGPSVISFEHYFNLRSKLILSFSKFPTEKEVIWKSFYARKVKPYMMIIHDKSFQKFAPSAPFLKVRKCGPRCWLWKSNFPKVIKNGLEHQKLTVYEQRNIFLIKHFILRIYF